MKYGYFDNQHKEYVITNPKTPTKWINYIGTLEFGGFIDHTGGSLLCKGDPAINRITKYIPQLPSSNFKGTSFYIREKSKDGYSVFSPFYAPCCVPYDVYECHVGLGYSTFKNETNKIRSEITVFVPKGKNVEIRIIKITNLRDEAVELDYIPVVEYTHFEAMKQFNNADWVPQTMQSKISKRDEDLLLTQYAFMRKDSAINYFSANVPIDSIESDRQIFLGENGYGDWSYPKKLNDEHLSNYEALRGDNIGALLIKAGSLKPKETFSFMTFLGQTDSIDNAWHLKQTYKDIETVEKLLEEQKFFWEDYLEKFIVETPDQNMNTMLNIHNPYQCFITKNWSRYLSLYQLGLGARGMGYRDTSQDLLGVFHADAENALNICRKLLQVQKQDGSAMHQFNPLSMIANIGEAGEDERADFYSDDHLWVIQAIAEYLKETGNYEFLNEIIPYYEKDKNDQPLKYASVYGHMKQGVFFTKHTIGKHGLPLLGWADWNDTINLPNGSESMLTACLYGIALKELIEIAKILNEPDDVINFSNDYQAIKKTFNEQGWDGDWYVSYFDEDGVPLGSKENQYGQIYLYGQAFPVMAGFASFERGKSSMKSVKEKLHTKHGIKVSAPGYNGYNPKYGGITTYPPGAKENSGIFMHPNPWAMIAECILGNGDQAYQYYSETNPVNKNDIIDIYELEPYVYCQNVLSDEHPQFGLARNSWLSGTASWMYQAGTKWILGIRPTYEGLMIDPCIPHIWDGFSTQRTFRNAIYSIQIKNPNHVNKGIKTITVDGEKISSNVLPIFKDGKHTVEVMMG